MNDRMMLAILIVLTIAAVLAIGDASKAVIWRAREDSNL
jgi:hypothetical protein